MFTRRIDWIAVNGAVRTAGALMVGNAFVGYLVLDKNNLANLGILLAIGILAIIGTSIQKKEV